MTAKKKPRKRDLKKQAVRIEHPPGPTVFAYGRVSTLQQGDGFSPEVQERQAVSYFEYRFKDKGDMIWGGYWHDKAVSAKIPFRERLVGSALWKTMRRGDHLVVSKLDRAFRSLLDQFETMDDLIARGVQVHMLDLNVDTASEVGRMVMGILSTIAEYERRRIRTRMMEGSAISVLKGNYPSNLPWGYRKIMVFGKPQIAWDWRKRNEAREYLKMKNQMGTYTKVANHLAGPNATMRQKQKHWWRVYHYINKELGLIAYTKARAELLGMSDPDAVPPPSAYELFTQTRDKSSPLRLVLDSFTKSEADAPKE